jgi:hypothetical protein
MLLAMCVSVIFDEIHRASNRHRRSVLKPRLKPPPSHDANHFALQCRVRGFFDVKVSRQAIFISVERDGDGPHSPRFP